MIMIRTPREEDWAAWHALDPALPFDRYLRIIRDRQGYLLLLEGEPAAVFRFSFFQERIPLGDVPACDSRFAAEALDLALLSWWEQDLLQRGYDRALLAAPCDDGILARLGALGFRPAGTLDAAGIPPVRFLFRSLQAGCACESGAPSPAL